MSKYFIVVILLHISCNLDFIWAYVCKVYTVIINHSLTMITSCNKMVNFNYVATGVALMLSEQLLCNWHMTMRTTIRHVHLSKSP
jgi:hypothetical protein